MPRPIDTFLAEIGLQRADHATHQSRRGPAIPMVRADLNHAVLSRMMEEAEALAPFLKLDKAVVFGLIRDRVFEEAEASPSGLVAREPEGESARGPERFSEMSIRDVLGEMAKLADVHHGQPRAPEWAGALDRSDEPDGSDL